jgi:chromosome segregation ATPase
MESIACDRLTDELKKYEAAREKLAAQLQRIENAKAQTLAQLNACAGAVQALTALLPSAPAASDTQAAGPVLTEEPEPVPAKDANGA